MKAIVGIVIAGVLVNTVGTAEPKQVNIALETVLRFDKKDQTPGFAAIDKVQDALQKIKEDLLFRRKNPYSMTFTDISGRRSNSRDMTFIDFISQAAKILKKYDDNDLEDVFAVINDESRRYIKRESGLQDLFGISEVRRHLSEQLDVLGDVPAKQLRRHLDNVITAVENKQKTGEKNDLLDIGNLLYLGAGAKFRPALKKLDRLLRKKDVNIEVVLKDTLRSLILDHYSNLNDKIKRELIDLAKDYWRAYSRNDGRFSRASSLKTIAVTRFSHLKNNKHDRKYKNRIKAYKNDVGHQTKMYVNKFRTSRDRELMLVDPKPSQFNNNTRLQTALRLKSTLPKKNEFNESSSENYKQEMKFKKYNSKKYKATPTNRHKDKKTFLEVSDESDFMVLTGGQSTKNSANIGRTGQKSTEESSEPIEKKKDEMHSSVETGEKYRTAAFISVENFITENPKTDDDLIKGNRFTAILKDIDVSVEGLTIESVESEPSIENTVMRKSNADDNPRLDKPRPKDVKEMIQNIEKQIKSVKEDVSYVRNLSMSTDKPSKPKFKAVASDEKLSNALSKTKNSYYPDSDSIDKDNEAFFSRDHFAVDSTASHFTFRANDNSDTINAAVITGNQNYTKTTVVGSTTDETIVTTVRKLNETNGNMSPKDTLITINKDENENIQNDTAVGLINNNNETVNANINNTPTLAVKIDDMKLNEIVHNITSKLKKQSDENFVLVPQSKHIFNLTTKTVQDALKNDNNTDDSFDYFIGKNL